VSFFENDGREGRGGETSGRYIDIDVCDELISCDFEDNVSSACTLEWWQKYHAFYKAFNKGKCLETEMAYANSEANAGRGWYNTL